MADVSVAEALRGKAPVGSQVTVKGWIRTRRDSKGGFSFLAINDGSCFDSIQVVAPGTLSNYQSEILH
jgi:asparaginyl-tRNA synthetase